MSHGLVIVTPNVIGVTLTPVESTADTVTVTNPFAEPVFTRTTLEPIIEELAKVESEDEDETIKLPVPPLIARVMSKVDDTFIVCADTDDICPTEFTTTVKVVVAVVCPLSVALIVIVALPAVVPANTETVRTPVPIELESKLTLLTTVGLDIEDVSTIGVLTPLTVKVVVCPIVDVAVVVTVEGNEVKVTGAIKGSGR